MNRKRENPEPTYPKPPAPESPPPPYGYRARLLEAHERIEQLKQQLGGVTKERDHFKEELDADVKHILALGRERDELKRENEQLKHEVEQVTGVSLDPSKGVHTS
jgi:hypothetical protein